MEVKILRKSNEGFKNYNQKHLKSDEPMHGCYCFVNKVIEDRLEYSFTFKEKAKKLGLSERNYENLNEFNVDEETLVYAENFMIVGVEDISEEVFELNKDEDNYGYDEDEVCEYDPDLDDWVLKIKTEPIIKSKSKEDFVLVPIKYVVKRIMEYEKIMNNPEYIEYNPNFVGPTEGSIYEFILDLTKI